MNGSRNSELAHGDIVAMTRTATGGQVVGLTDRIP